MSYVNISLQKWHILTFFRKNGIVLHIYSYIGAFGSSSGAQISCSGACSSSSRACISSSGQRLQSLEAPEALSFSRGLAFSPSSATTLPHFNYVCYKCSNLSTVLTSILAAQMKRGFHLLQSKQSFKSKCPGPGE